jgi:gliding motility-associated-like protein
VNATAICVGQQTAALIATGATSYSWSPGTGLNSTSLAGVAASPTITTTYAVTGFSAGCFSTTFVTVTVNPLPSPTITPSFSAGCAPLCISFNEISNTQGQFDWSFGDGVKGVANPSGHCYFLSGDFVVTLKLIDQNGCYNKTSAAVKVYPKPVADFVYNPIRPHLGVDDEITFTDASYDANITNWTWYFLTPNQIIDTVQNPKVTYTQTGDFNVTLIVTSDFGCSDTTYKVITVSEDFAIYIPNAFTPNGDNINDVFYPKGLGFTKYSMSIFDRWGEEIFKSTDLEKGWNGTYQKRSGDVCPNDTYIYKIQLETIYGEHKDILGHVTISN